MVEREGGLYRLYESGGDEVVARVAKNVFNYGIDGWKLDGTATLFYTPIGPVPLFYKPTYDGLMTTRTYMDHYYRDEYQHGLTQNPEFVTMSRSIDSWYHPEGFAPIDASPVNWVGCLLYTS